MVSLASDRDRIGGLLGGIAGLGQIDTGPVLIESRPVCSAAALVDRGARAGAGVRTNHADSVFRDGDYLVVTTTVPPGPPLHVYVDYVDPGGDVVHLRPNPVLPDSLVDGGSAIQLGVEAADASAARTYQLGEPLDPGL
jgi:hypothetical protein